MEKEQDEDDRKRKKTRVEEDRTIQEEGLVEEKMMCKQCGTENVCGPRQNKN